MLQIMAETIGGVWEFALGFLGRVRARAGSSGTRMAENWEKCKGVTGSLRRAPGACAAQTYPQVIHRFFM